MPTTMTRNPITISALAGLDTSDSGLTAEDRKKLENKLRDAAHKFETLKPYDVGHSLLDSLSDSLQTPVADVLGTLWKQHRELRVAAQAKTPANTGRADVPLIDHTLTSTLKPSVTITLKVGAVGTLPIKIVFDVEVSLALQALVITIENAKITNFSAGTIKSSVVISLDGQELWTPFERTLHLDRDPVLPDGGIALN